MMRQPSIDIIIYPITGRQGPITVPHRFCEECDLTIRAVRRVVDELDDQHLRVLIRPWLLHWWRPIWRGGWHAPIVTVNGRVVTQGIVPSRATLLAAIAAAHGRPRSARVLADGRR